MSLIQDESNTTLLDRQQKRKREETESIELDRRPFTIRPDTSDPFAAPRVFTPICILSRAHLPLAYLDTACNGSRLFAAHISILEAYDDEGINAVVLIAEDEKDHKLYAIERTQRRTYALCRLGSWVKRSELERTARIVVRSEESQAKRQALHPVENGQPWWSRAAVTVSNARPGSDDQLPALAMSSNLTDTVEATITKQDCEATNIQCVEAQSQSDNLESVPSGPVHAQGVLQELVKHYLETLYMSRTSLAYFVKGPVSRTRAAMSGQATPDLDLTVLIAFLREILLSASVMDKKYKDTVISIVGELPVSSLATPEQTAKAKRKRKWKAKRDKTGLFMDEKEYLESWWRADTAALGAPSSTETVEAAMKRRVPRLRSRETYMQIILALEVLALEASLPLQTSAAELEQGVNAESQTLESQAPGSQAATDGKKQKSRKLQDLPALLEVLVDRLCIWHSLDLHSPAKRAGENDEDGKDGTADELKSFCFEVLIPFYMARIPKPAAMVNKKLGGPSAPTPVKRRSTSSRKPGEPAVGPAPERKPRKPLSRVASDALGQTSRPAPMLHRSATDTDALLAHIKRESSETPLPFDSIPPVKPPQPRKRTSLMHSISFNKREVDLSAMSQANEIRMRKKAETEEKLQEAITALKKPNRSLATKELAASADVSFAKATARGRTAPSKTAAQSFHVAATPKHPRTIKATPAQRADVGSARNARPSASFVPSSSGRLRAEAAELPPSSFAVPQTGHRPRHGVADVAETPFRGFAKFMPAGLAHLPGTLESPVASRHATAIAQTPSKPMRSVSLMPPSAAQSLVVASPNIVRSVTPAKHCTVEPATIEKESNIYARLGWDDDNEELT